MSTGDDDPLDRGRSERRGPRDALAAQERPCLRRDPRRGRRGALAYLAAEDGRRLPSLVILDLNLPRLHGLDVLREIRAGERTRVLPVVVLTSSREERDLEAAYAHGANSYVQADPSGRLRRHRPRYRLVLAALATRPPASPDPLRILLVEDSEDDEYADPRRACAATASCPRALARGDARGAGAAAPRRAVGRRPVGLPAPTLDAADALEVVKASGLDLPFIIVSGAIGEEIAVQVMRAGAADYLRKENVVRLVPAIRREVAERAGRAAKRRLEQDLAASLAAEQRLRAEAERANRVKDEFLALVSHEPARRSTSCSGARRCSSATRSCPSSACRALAVIRRSAEHQVRMVEDLLDVRGSPRASSPSRAKPVALDREVAAALGEMGAVAAAQGTALQVDLAASGVVVRGDPARLRQIVRNLVSNALTFGGVGGAVRIVLARREERIELTVIDEGPGIDPAIAARLFERFVQADPSATRRHGGSGSA